MSPLEPAPPDAPAAPIVITGSRIPRTDLTAVSPVTTVPGEEFKLQGTTNAEDVLNQLPQVNPSQGLFSPPGATGIATVDLRGLGSVRTLVLVNGHRLMPGDPRFPQANIDDIPSPLIGQVEVLTGGAGAVYGSDAVAGVVNFILDTKLDGVKAEAQIGGYQHDNRDDFARTLLDARQFLYPKGNVLDGRRLNMSAAFGLEFMEGRGHLTLYGGYRKVAGVTQAERDYGSCPITARIVDGSPSSILECGGPTISYPGNFFDNLDNVYLITADRTFVPGLSRFNYAPWHYIQRPDKRYTAGGFANLDLSRGLNAYVEVMAMKDRNSWKVGPSGDFRHTETINCDNPLLSNQERSLICRDGNYVGQTAVLDANGQLVQVTGEPTPFFDPLTGTYNRAWLLISLRNIQGGSIEDVLEHRSIRLLAGVKGELGRGVSYDASYLFGRTSLDREYRNNLSVDRLTRALDVVSDPSTGQPICRSALIARELGATASGADANCVPWDVFATGQVTPEATAYLTIPASMSGWFREQIGNANATVELDQWGIGSPWSEEGAAINVGAEFRKDSLEFDPDAFTEVGEIAGLGEQFSHIRGSIDTREVFGEVRIPVITDRLVKRLALEGGFRRSWYSNSRTSLASNTYKLAVDVTALPGLRFRASQQGANRAPNVQELLGPSQHDSFLRDPCTGPDPTATEAQCLLTGLTAAQYGNLAKANGLFEYNAIIGGNENLNAEVATTRALGIVLQPRVLPGLNATIDWWDIRLKGAISSVGAQSIVDSCIATGDPFFCTRIHRASNGSLRDEGGYVDNRLANLGSLKVRGIDGSADYTIALGRLGSANIGFRGAYVLHWIVDNGGTSISYDCAGLFGAPCGMQPRWKHTARTTWDLSRKISLSLQWRHTGGVKLAALDPKFNLTDEVSPGHTRIRAQDYFDATSVFRVRKGFELRVGVNNLLDRQPPLVIGNTAAGDGPYNANTYPTWYDPLGRYIFASAAVTFKP